MLWRHLCLVRAVTAAGLLSCSTLGASAAGEPEEPIPGADAQAETVKVLEAEKAGALSVEVRGQGQDKVRVTIKNTSSKRLNVVLPPGLVASSSVGQGGAGGGGGGGGFQSMGLGPVANRSGGFGQFAAAGKAGFKSVSPTDPGAGAALTVPVGQKVDVDIPSVCLNFGLPTPTPRDRFRLVDVEDYSKDARVRKALRALATLGTSHGTAQAAMWRVCNNVPFEVMLAQGGKVVNPAEVALASRFVDALDQSADSVDPAYLTEARVFVTVEGEGAAAKDAKRLAAAIDGQRILGLPARACSPGEVPRTTGPALHLGVRLTLSPQSGEVRGRVVVQAAAGLGEANDWSTLGQVNFAEASTPVLDADRLAQALDRAVGSAYVTAKVSRRAIGTTTLRIENKLPFTVANLTVKAGTSAGSPTMTLGGLGVGPGRTGLATIPAAGGAVDQVELNGL